MREVLEVPSENKSKVEDILKRDDEVSRGNITVKSASSLDIEEDVYSEESVNELVEWDEISDEEAGFMIGYNGE